MSKCKDCCVGYDSRDGVILLASQAAPAIAEIARQRKAYYEPMADTPFKQVIDAVTHFEYLIVTHDLFAFCPRCSTQVDWDAILKTAKGIIGNG